MRCTDSICWDLANELSYQIREVYSDEGESSESLTRPQLTRLLDAIDSGEVKRVIAYSIDRLTRRLYHLQRLLERFNTCTLGERLTLFRSALLYA